MWRETAAGLFETTLALPAALRHLFPAAELRLSLTTDGQPTARLLEHSELESAASSSDADSDSVDEDGEDFHARFKLSNRRLFPSSALHAHHLN